MKKLINPLEPFKFWASKPLDIAIAYIEAYAKDRKVLLDPFGGSGVFCYAAILKNIKAIYNDLCPYAIFLARNVIKPIDLKLLQNTLNEVLKRTLPKDIKTKNNEIIIQKGTKIEEAIKWFYTTKCNICGSDVEVDYYLWDTEYIIKKEKGDKYAEEKLLKEKDKRYRIFLDVICDIKEKEILKGKKVKVYTFTRKKINDKWEEAVKKDPKEWIEKSRRKKYEASVVNEIVAILLRSKIAKRRKRFPIIKKFKCPIDGEQKQPLNEEDWKKIKTIESLEYPFPEYIPEFELVYKHENGNIKNFLQYRERQTFVEEDLSTIEENEWKQKIPKLKHYFTKRNLIALSLIFWSINCIEDEDMKDQIYLIFVSNLHMNAKFDREGKYGGWATGYYASLDDFKENNVLFQFLKSWKEVKKIKEYVWDIFSSKLNYITYDETWNVKEFLEHLNKPKEKTILWLREDAKKLNQIIKRRVVDIVFTDPPYKCGKHSVQYFELTFFYLGWLTLDKKWKTKYGDIDWWKEEIIENKQQEKNLYYYIRALRDAFLSVNEIVKQNSIWIITYHSPSKDVWEEIKKIFEEINLRVPSFEEIKTHKIRSRGKGSFYVTRYASIGEDAYIVLMKEEKNLEEIRRSSKLPVSEFLEKVFEKMKSEIKSNEGLITWEMFTKYYPDVVIRFGGPYDHKKDYKDLFESITIEISEGYRILDRDKVGEELYRRVYEEVDPEKFLTKILKLIGRNKKEISRNELELKILTKINNRIDENLKIKILKNLFTFDYIGNKYIFKPTSKSLNEFLLDLGKLQEKELPLPFEITYKIKETAKTYGGHKVKEIEGNTQLIVSTRNFEYLIVVADESSIRRFIFSTTEKERINKIVVYLNYSTNEMNLIQLAKQLKPAKFVVVPYKKYLILLEALREYEPLDKLKEHVIS